MGRGITDVLGTDHVTLWDNTYLESLNLQPT